MKKKILFVLIAIACLGNRAYSQQDDSKQLPLDDMSGFKDQAGNWRIVGGVVMDPSVDIHPPEEPAPAVKESRKSKKSKAAPVQPKQAVTFTEGKGILLNINDNSKKDNLVSILEHGDIELQMEVMLPKGSNSGIYLQGRYELQLMDSWGVKNAKFSDMGGIYRNWETQPGKIYMGKAPLANAAKAPGLWQNVKISFRAPKFDDGGNKIQNARFASVVLNGVTIHENVEVPLPTGGPIENNEKPTGPLLIQGDHGPVAIRNIRYKLLKDLEYKVSPVKYQVFHGNFKSTNDFANAKPALTGQSEELSVDVVDIENAYGIKMMGELTVPEDATYHFKSVYTGGSKFILNNKELFNFPTPDGWRSDDVSVDLKAGTYPFEIHNFKDASWMPPRYAVYASTATSGPKPLHSLNSYPPDDEPTSSIFIQTGKEPKLVRAFLDYKGDRKHRLTHTIGVGEPSGLNYIYDLRAGNLVCIWRGDFIDATPMWHDRGDGSFRPLGAALFLNNNQALSYLASDQEPFPASPKEGELKSRGYMIEEESRRPVFVFNYQDLEVEDRVIPDAQNNQISHEINIKTGTPKEGLFYKIAEGTNIKEMPDGSFAINDQEYYIKTDGTTKPSIRKVGDHNELIVPMNQGVKYSIIW